MKGNKESRERKAELLQALRDEIGDCRRCKLAATRTTIVFGEGNPDARVMFIGEGPGREEDLQGRPFVGRAGVLLTAIIEKGMKIRREDVYIANVVKCRPTVDMAFVRDRPPDEEETAACGGFLRKQIEIIRPEVIVTLGNPSTKFLLGIKEGITKAHGRWYVYQDIPVLPTYHPSFVLRNGGDASPLKKDVWEDIKKVIARLSGEGETDHHSEKGMEQNSEKPEEPKGEEYIPTLF
jgi:uracil-DNA glycosylase family 4